MAERTPITTPGDSPDRRMGEDFMELDVDCWVVDLQSFRSSCSAAYDTSQNSHKSIPQAETAQPRYWQCVESADSSAEAGERTLKACANTLPETNSLRGKSRDTRTFEIWRDHHAPTGETPNTTGIKLEEIGSITARTLSRVTPTAEVCCGLSWLELDTALVDSSYCEDSAAEGRHSLWPLETETCLPKTITRQRSHIEVRSRLSPKGQILQCSSSTGTGIDYKRQALLALNRKRQKTGRKPSSHQCAMCTAALPYKKELIQHLKDEHGIDRSKSLMYKRLQLGKEELQRLYGS